MKRMSTLHAFALVMVLASGLGGCAEEIAAPTTVTRPTGVASADLFGIPSPFYPAYAAYFAAIGSGATTRALPAATIHRLEPYFVNDVLAAVRYASSDHTGQSAMTDCYTIYFPAGARPRRIRARSRPRAPHAARCDPLAR